MFRRLNRSKIEATNLEAKGSYILYRFPKCFNSAFNSLYLYNNNLI